MEDELKSVYNIGRNILKTITAPFYVPTFIRRNFDNDWGKYGIALCVVDIIAPLLAGAIMERPGKVDPFQNSYYLNSVGILAMSNALSGLYEWFRYERDKIKKSTSSSSANSSGLEEKVEEKPIEQQKPEQEPVEIVNPWKVNIDGLDDSRYGGVK